MLLIQSDFLKALFFLLFPIVDFVSGPIKSDSTFCQASGFFLTIGIEACDVAIFLITLHGALYIFRPKRSGGESGLYPYRRIAYAVYIVFPVLLACLAFVKGTPAYENTGEYCYLSVRDPWYRMALSWVPRYVVFISILVLSCVVYFYVTTLLGRYGRRSSFRPSQNRVPPPPTPPLAYHGLIPSGPESRRPSAQTERGGTRDRPTSVGSLWTAPLIQGRRPSRLPDSKQASWRSDQRQIPNWDDWNFKSSSKRLNLECETPSTGVSTPVIQPLSAQIKPPAPVHGVPSARRDSALKHVTRAGDDTESSRETTPQTATPNGTTMLPAPILGETITSASIMDLIAVLRRGPSDFDSSHDSSEVYLSSAGADANDGLARSRHRTRRQLKLLFVYPVVYILTWIFPFVSHILQYDDAFTPDGSDGPFWLLALSLASLCTQGTVDCVLFMVREKPWRHVKGGFWESLRKRMTFTLKGRIAGSGRTAEEMVNDGRTARARRNHEMAQEDLKRTERAQMTRDSLSSRQAPRKGGAHWWDAEAGVSGGEDD
ncbi:uncharacterized protein E0L32_000491 [Thyridium curvatum]|uniref:G protein-coupled receptor GPR1 n=1 Tax=Thyridium curvatum TaxID=1093900 RepID=A0A507B2X9_9PEZI|nr:uncharacterized protein E0L32_000491 [Thyridium curvatum]TPX14097.1 hypothetical protein E0L32_000491 [Thyridium curvatum]